MTKDAKELIAEIAEKPALDEFMRRDPAGLTKPEFANIVEGEREKRAQFIAAEEKKAMKKQGLEEE